MTSDMRKVQIGDCTLPTAENGFLNIRLFRNPAISNLFSCPVGLRNGGIRLHFVYKTIRGKKTAGEVMHTWEFWNMLSSSTIIWPVRTRVVSQLSYNYNCHTWGVVNGRDKSRKVSCTSDSCGTQRSTLESDRRRNWQRLEVRWLGGAWGRGGARKVQSKGANAKNRRKKTARGSPYRKSDKNTRKNITDKAALLPQAPPIPLSQVKKETHRCQ